MSEKVNISIGDSKTVWHRPLGHPTMKILNSIVKYCNFLLNDNVQLTFCESCQLGKTHNLPFNFSQSRAANNFDLVHYDFWGPAPITSTDGYRYYILFVDDFGKYSWICSLKQKSEAFEVFKNFLIYVKTWF